MVLLFIVVFFGLAATENVRVSINDKYLDYGKKMKKIKRFRIWQVTG